MPLYNDSVKLLYGHCWFSGGTGVFILEEFKLSSFEFFDKYIFLILFNITVFYFNVGDT